ncbi:UDP-glycosyltransferase 87A1 [Punica granatum]|uniref:Uncharacterized protein n=2 Tax=Punica granatum TaxID=22663 RepID=A0A2I0JRD3_PUNGR|nr:UDP-glycosyltransferase 87A1 [Punica granatum]PKI58463.1 hypothetical protein CRG98_021148 [Punica granatum]
MDRDRKAHLVAIPYPGRGHINPMMNLCKLLVSKSPSIYVTFVVTEEWLALVGSDPKPDTIRFACIPNVIPSESIRALDFPAFIEAVLTKMEDPVERLLDALDKPVIAIIADTYLFWAVRVANKRDIPIASLWTMSASVFTVFDHFELLLVHRHFPADLSDRGDEIVEYIPGLPPTRLADLTTFFGVRGRVTLQRALDCFPWVPKTQYLLFTNFYELESSVIDALKAKFSMPIYTVGPTIPYFELELDCSSSISLGLGAGPHQHHRPSYLQWLDSQPTASVLYISLGSFLSVSREQMTELVTGVRESGVKFLWVSRDLEENWLSDWFRGSCGIDEEKGVIVPWCNQLMVLSHPSVGGFWTHCGLNSTLEAIYAGVPILAFPIFWDQVPNSKLIAEDWKIGWRVKRPVAVGEEEQQQLVVSGVEIAGVIRKFMDLESDEQMQLRRRAMELQEICRQAIQPGGSSYSNIDAFASEISKLGCFLDRFIHVID